MAEMITSEDGIILSRGQAWSSHERAQLRKLAGDGCTAAEAARRLRRTQSEVRAEAWRLGVPLIPAVGRWTTAEEKRLVELAGRCSAAYVAAELGRSIPSVRSKAKEMAVLWVGPRLAIGGVVARRYSKREDAEILDAVRIGRPIREVAIALNGRSQKSVRRRLDRLRGRNR